MNLGTTRPKLIATDLDGTIVHHDGTITPRTLAAFQRARDLGVEIWFVTGRPPRWMGEIKMPSVMATRFVVTVRCTMTCIVEM